MDNMELILQELQKVNGRLDKLENQQAEIAKSVVTLMDAEFKPQFNLLAEGQEEILRRMPNEDDMDIIDGRLDTLEAIVKKHTKEIDVLKKAN